MAKTLPRDIPADWPVYRIVRFRFNGRPRTLRNNLTLAEAQAHCKRADTSSHSTGNGAWFDGYDLMKGVKMPKAAPPEDAPA